MGSRAVKYTVCLPSLASLSPAISADGRMECITDVVKVLAPYVWNFHIVQQCRINLGLSRVTLDGTHVIMRPNSGNAEKLLLTLPC